jgi:hypothetical protein
MLVTPLLRSAARAAVCASLCALAGPAVASAAEPRMEVAAKKLRSSLTCSKSVADATRTPVLLVTGTGIDGREAWPQGLGLSLRRDGIPRCFIDFPQHTTGDIQVAVQYVVSAIRAVRKRAGRDIAVYGISQGGLLPRFALTYWPSLRSKVSDVVLVAGTQHGTTVFESLLAGCSPDCRLTAAVWQQASGSALIRAINRSGSDETPGPTGWTTVRSTTDGVVQPATGPDPTSALAGASDLVIQDICADRQTDHISTGVDSVSYAALIDAVRHKGPANASRIDPGVCQRPYAPGLDPDVTKARVDELTAKAISRSIQGADGGILLSKEPVLKPWMLRR